MLNRIRLKLSKILTNNWVITLSATLIGVFAALYLNEWLASKKLRDQTSIATQNVLAEMSANNQKLKKAIARHTELLETMVFLGDYTDEADNLIAPPDSLNKFRMTYPDLVVIEDSTFVRDGFYEYDGEINVNVSFPHFDLTTIAWTTLKNSGISTTYGFECLMFLESVDKVTDEVLQKNMELLEFFTGARDTGDENEKLIGHLNLLIDYEESLVKMYQACDQELKNCD